MLGNKVAAVAITSVCLVALSGCTGTMKEKDVEKNVSDALTAKIGVRPDKIDCPGDLAAKVGTKMRCKLYKDGDSLGLTVTVTSVDHATGKSHFEVEVDKTK